MDTDNTTASAGPQRQPHADKALIESLGGAARVAELLGLDKDGGTQRVHNWCFRGIPAAMKVSRPDLFMPGLQRDTDAPRDRPRRARRAGRGMTPLPILLSDEEACPGAALPTDEAEMLEICRGCARMAAFEAAGGNVRGVIPAAVVVDGEERCANRRAKG